MATRCVSSAVPLFSCLTRLGIPMISNRLSRLNVESDVLLPTVTGPTVFNLHYAFRIVNTTFIRSLTVIYLVIVVHELEGREWTYLRQHQRVFEGGVVQVRKTRRPSAHPKPSFAATWIDNWG